jgi:hypothetical protein
MKNALQKPPQGSVSRGQGWAARIGVLAVGAAVCISTLSPTTASAGSVSQLKFLQTLAQLTGDGGQFSASSSGSDYVQWAKNKGMVQDWNAKGKLSSDVVALSLVQLFGLNPRRYGGDLYRNLEREGIIIERTSSVSSEALAALYDNPVVTLKTFQLAAVSTSPTKPGSENGNGAGFGFGWYVHNGVPLPPGHPTLPPGLEKKVGTPNVRR